MLRPEPQDGWLPAFRAGLAGICAILATEPAERAFESGPRPNLTFGQQWDVVLGGGPDDHQLRGRWAPDIPAWG